MLTRAGLSGSPHREAPELQRRSLASACRILAFRGLAEDILGHVSQRTDSGVLVRCRGPRERGLLFTDPDDIRFVDETTLAAEGEDYAAPNEVFIHTRVLRARPDVSAVVHAHPPAVVAADLAGLDLRPIVGAYNIPAARLADDGIPTYKRCVLVNSVELGDELAEAIGDRPACVMRGHGLVTTGATVAEAVNTALHVNSLADMTLRVAAAGGTAPTLPPGDLRSLPDLGSTFNDEQLWRFQLHALDAAGLA